MFRAVSRARNAFLTLRVCWSSADQAGGVGRGPAGVRKQRFVQFRVRETRF